MIDSIMFPLFLVAILLYSIAAITLLHCFYRMAKAKKAKVAPGDFFSKKQKRIVLLSAMAVFLYAFLFYVLREHLEGNGLITCFVHGVHDLTRLIVKPPFSLLIALYIYLSWNVKESGESSK